MDSPLSDLDNHDVVDDSEDEGGLYGPKIPASASNNGPGVSFQNQQTKEKPSTMMAPPIDYFAGFQDPPAPSIAERAKTRQRKTHEKARPGILDLTVDGLTQPIKHKETKSKKKAANTVTGANQTPSPDMSRMNQTSNSVKPPVINAKTKIRPRPVKKPGPLSSSPLQDRITQETLPMLTSPFLPKPNPSSGSSRVELPPCDPLPKSPLALDKGVHVPPIEFLPPPQDDTDTPLPSSFAEENVDELQINHDEHQLARNNSGDPSLPPPPTFFAGSSSGPSSNHPTFQPPTPPTINLLDLTDLPSTAVAPLVNTMDPKSKIPEKSKKPRKPKKAKKDAGEDELAAAKVTQSTRSNKKGKSKVNKVTVEVLVPLPVHHQGEDPPTTMRKHSRSEEGIQESMEDELNIQDGDADIINTPMAGPSYVTIANKIAQAETGTTDHDDFPEKSSKSSKRKTRKRRDIEETNSSPLSAASRKKKRASSSIEEAEEGLENVQYPPKNPARKRKRNGEDLEPKETTDAIQASRAVKGKRKMVISSDDEDGDAVDPPQQGEPPPSSPTSRPDEDRKGKRKALPEDSEADTSTADHLQDDGNVLKDTRPISKLQVSPPPHKYETSTVAKYPSLTSRYTIAPKSQTTGMSELLRRVNSHPSSPNPVGGRGAPVPGSVYSPYLKSSRRTLSRIAPLHPNRKMPPPPLPPLPPKKKSKKELEMEEKWEEEIIEEIGGISEWMALSESEKKDLKRMKRDREMGYCED